MPSSLGFDQPLRFKSSSVITLKSLTKPTRPRNGDHMPSHAKIKAVLKSTTSQTSPISVERSGSKTPPSVAQTLTQAAEISNRKNADYGDSQKKFGEVLKTMCPKGIHLNTVEEINVFGVFAQKVHKMIRYSNLIFNRPDLVNFESATDTANDEVVYSAMLANLTAELISKRGK